MTLSATASLPLPCVQGRVETVYLSVNHVHAGGQVGMCQLLSAAAYPAPMYARLTYWWSTRHFHVDDFHA